MSKGKGSFGCEFGASHCNHMGTVLHTCVEECVNRWVVSGVGRGMGVLDWIQGEGAVSGGSSPHWFQGNICLTQMYSTRRAYVKS